MRTYFLITYILALTLTSASQIVTNTTAGGMPYQLFPGNGTQKIQAGNIVKYHVTYIIKDSIYFSSFGKPPVYIRIEKNSQSYDVSELFPSLSIGDSIVAIQMLDTFIKRSPSSVPPSFKNGDTLFTYLKVLDVFDKDSAVMLDEAAENKKHLATEIKFLEGYLTKKNITTQQTASGIFVQIINPGTGDMIGPGKKVSVNYTGITLSGKKFDSNTDTAFQHVTPLEFITGAGTMIKGFDEPIQTMRKGTVAKVYVPSILGYGARPNPSSGIMPYENLVFDIKIVDVKEK